MSIMNKAAEDAERLAAMFSGLAGLSDELKRVGSLQTAADEAQGRIDAAAARQAKQAAEGSQRLAAAEALLADVKGKIEGAQKAAEAIAAQARREAEAVAVAAYSDADKLSKDVSARLARQESEAAARIAQMQQEKASLQALLVETRAALDEAAGNLADAESRKAAVEIEIDRIRSLFK